AAEAYARIENKIAAVCVTSGPGGTNAITGVVGGWLDSIPMLIISGQVKRETTIWSVPLIGLRQLGDQEFDIIHTVANMTKYAVMVTEPTEIAYHLEKAIYLAMHGRRGPVWIDIPLDVQGAKIDVECLTHFVPSDEEIVPLFTEEKARKVIEIIKNAKRPLLLVGSAVRFSGVCSQFLQLVEKLKIPVVTAWNANDTIAFDNDYFVGMAGTIGVRSANFAVQACDVLLSIGSRLNLRMVSYNKNGFATNAYKIIVDIDAKELQKPTVIPDMPIEADAKQFIEVLLQSDYEENAQHAQWLVRCKELLKKYPAVSPEYHHDNAPINPYVAVDMLFDKLSCNDKIVCGNGSACVISFQAGKIKQGQRLFTNSGCAAMGYGLPAAIGAAFANKNERIICIDGDGSLMMNIQELATVAYHNLNLKLFVINNNGYHSIRQTQTNVFNPPLIGIGPESGLGFPNFELIAKAFDIQYFRLDSEKNAQACFDEVLCQDGPVFCEMIVDYTQNFAPKLSSKVMPDGKIISPSLDDMFPFLPSEEYNNIRRYINE
ncbi:MAG: thiamine pyrophosphate-binding protein, partial [Oscillospiraceae bacterium]